MTRLNRSRLLLPESRFQTPFIFCKLEDVRTNFDRHSSHAPTTVDIHLRTLLFALVVFIGCTMLP